MKINTRIIVILCVVFVAFLIALGIISQFFIISTFSDIEHKQAVTDMQRVLSRLSSEVEDVAADCRQWAEWDDTSAFVDDLNPGYIQANLAEPALFRNMKINYVLFYNSSGNLVYFRGYDPEDGTKRDVPRALTTIIHNSIIPEGATIGVSGRRGYSLLNGEPVILAGYPITTSDQQGPVRGTLIMVRQLDETQINTIAQQTDLDITLQEFPKTNNTALTRGMDLKKMDNGAILVTPVNNSVIEGSAYITGIENTPTKILVVVESSRTLYQQVLVSLEYIAGAVIILAIVLIFAIRWPLRKYITRPVLSLDSAMKVIGASGDISRHITVQGDDEILSLANSLNRMLEEIDKSHNQTLESEAKFRTLAETSVAGIFVYRQKILYANPAAELQTGYTRDELLKMDFWELIHPDFQENVRNLAQNMLREDNSSARTEFKIIRKDGVERWMDASATGFQYESGRAIFTVRVDITRQKRNEEKLRENEEKFRALAENTPDIVFSADVNGKFRYISHQVEKYGFRVKDLVGRSVSDFVFPDDVQEFSENLESAFKYGVHSSTPFRILDKEQNIHWLEGNFAVIHDKSGICLGLQGMFRDITDRRRAMDAITLANKKLNLMYDITRHDILNKITILFGLIDMTNASTSPAEREQFLGEIRDAGQAIFRQIALTRDYQEVGVKSPRWNLMKEVISRTIADFSCTGIQFVSTIDHLEIYADPLIEKVIYNLVDNATRYGGKITSISFSTEISDKGLEMICEDDGIGVDAGVKEKIFERGFGNNTGLGLFLSREILMITGISIREAGEPGTGARFIITLPKGTYRFVEK